MLAEVLRETARLSHKLDCLAENLREIDLKLDLVDDMIVLLADSESPKKTGQNEDA